MTIKQHNHYTESDYRELNRKGYTDEEIVAIWNRDASQGKGPLVRNDTNGQVFDIVGYLNQ